MLNIVVIFCLRNKRYCLDKLSIKQHNHLIVAKKIHDGLGSQNFLAVKSRFKTK